MNRIRWSVLFATVVAMLGTTLPQRAAWSWGDGGHMIVASIAYERLNPRAKAEADRLLKIPINPATITAKSLDFINASYWPDAVRRSAGFEFSGDLHFIDVPFSPDGTPIPDDILKPDNIVFALIKYVGTLQNSPDDNAKAQALRFVIHFVGDIHQPLHCVSRVDKDHPQGDKGGNDIEVKMRDASGRLRTVKLHSVWDGGLNDFPRMGANFAPPPLAEIPPAVAKVLQDNPATDPVATPITGADQPLGSIPRAVPVPAWQAGGPFGYTTWMQESVDLAKTKVYPDIQDGAEVGPDYIADRVPVARRRVAWAGYRLAALLNAIWPQPQ